MTLSANWNGDINQLDLMPATGFDQEFGYDDMLLAPPAVEGLPMRAESLVAPAVLNGQTNPSAGIVAEAIRSQPSLGGTDQLFRLANGGVVLRRSRFTDECGMTVRPDNQLALSEDAARALGFIGSFGQNGDASGELWCQRRVAGISQANMETAWVLSTQPGQPGLRYLKTTLDMISEIRAGRMPSSIPTADQARARKLAAAFPAQELASLTQWATGKIAEQNAPNEVALSDWHTVRAAVIFTAVAGVLHLLWSGTGGGRGPGGGGGSWWQIGLKGLFGRAVSRGRTSTNTAVPAPETATTEAPTPAQPANSRTALPDVARGILAYHGHATTPGTTAVPVPGRVPVVTRTAVPGIAPIPVVPVPVAIPAPAFAPVVVMPRFVPVL